MNRDIAPRILRRAHELDGPNLDRVASLLGAVGWGSLINGLTFQDLGTGGGCLALTARTEAGPIIVITDGEADVPVETDQFYLGIEVETEHLGAEAYGISVIDGKVTLRSGSFAGSMKISLS